MLGIENNVWYFMLGLILMILGLTNAFKIEVVTLISLLNGAYYIIRGVDF